MQLLFLKEKIWHVSGNENIRLLTSFNNSNLSEIDKKFFQSHKDIFGTTFAMKKGSVIYYALFDLIIF